MKFLTVFSMSCSCVMAVGMPSYASTLTKRKADSGLSAGASSGIWSNEQRRALTYCVADEFGDRKESVVKALITASEWWEQTADIDFIHMQEYDAACNSDNSAVLFDVRPVNDGKFLANAFFPNAPRPERNLLIDDSAYWMTTYSLENIMAHELGHVLGFRHEHVRNENPVWCIERLGEKADDLVPITEYDKDSIMHYPQCREETGGLTMSVLDRIGAAKVYGAAQHRPVLNETVAGGQIDHERSNDTGQAIPQAPAETSETPVPDAQLPLSPVAVAQL